MISGMDLTTVAGRMKHMREKFHITQTQLAVRAGLSPSAVSNIEAEAREGKGSLPQIAEALGVRHKWLAYGMGEMYDMAITQGDNVTFLEMKKPQRQEAAQLSPHALELGMMFDMIPIEDRVRRAQVYTKAMQVIVTEIELMRTQQQDQKT
jgi:transcriptional regulator with XRE-family HTH domain